MSAVESFDWFVSLVIQNSNPEIRDYIKRQREYFLTLRSEDERLRFVEQLIAESKDIKKVRISAKNAP